MRFLFLCVAACASYRCVRGNEHASICPASRPSTAISNDSSRDSARPHDPHYLPSGFYDALENPISEAEYWRQIEFEQKHGVPFYRDRESERRRLRASLSIRTYRAVSCEGERTQHVTERDVCYKSTAGRSYFVESMSSNAELTTYVDGDCTEDPFPCNWGITDPKGCFTTDAFESLKVTTRDLPA